MSFLQRLSSRLLKGLRFAATLFPRDPSIWAFGGSKGLRFGENSMYFFRYCHRESGRYCIWLTRSEEIVQRLRAENLPVYHTHSLRGIFYGLRAGWHLFDVSPDDTHPITSRGARIVNLWHGIPLKDIRCITPVQIDYEANRHLGWFQRLKCYDFLLPERYWLVHPNRFQLPEMSQTFNLPETSFIFADLPRNLVFQPEFRLEDYLLPDMIEERAALQERLGQFDQVLGYFPTWRSDGRDLFLGVQSLEELERLNRFLQEINCCIVTKWHGCSFAEYAHTGASQTAAQINEQLKQCSNIIALPFHTDMNSTLLLVDLLITDYSSVFFDYLLTDRPQLFFPYDLETYREQWGFLLPYEESMPGAIVRDLPAFISEVRAYHQAPEAYAAQGAEKRAALRNRVFEAAAPPETIVARMKEVSTPTTH